MERFTGNCSEIGPVDVTAMLAWLQDIDFRNWPQQSVTVIRPAMVTDPDWHGFGLVAEPVVESVMSGFPGLVTYQVMLSAVMPGEVIEPHTDSQAPDWLFRVHVPLMTNIASLFIAGGSPHFLEVGKAYRINTEAVHSVSNEGETPRVHLMWDVKG
jgi:hypothetical protein